VKMSLTESARSQPERDSGEETAWLT